MSSLISTRQVIYNRSSSARVRTKSMPSKMIDFDDLAMEDSKSKESSELLTKSSTAEEMAAINESPVSENEEIASADEKAEVKEVATFPSSDNSMPDCLVVPYTVDGSGRYSYQHPDSRISVEQYETVSRNLFNRLGKHDRRLLVQIERFIADVRRDGFFASQAHEANFRYQNNQLIQHITYMERSHEKDRKAWETEKAQLVSEFQRKQGKSGSEAQSRYDKLMNLKNKIADISAQLHQEISSLEATVEDTEAARDQNSAESAELRQQIADLQIQRQLETSKIKELTMENEELKTSNAIDEDIASRFGSESNFFQEKLDTAEATIASLQTSIDEASSAVKSSAEYKILQTKYNDLQTKYNIVKMDLNNTKSQLDNSKQQATSDDKKHEKQEAGLEKKNKSCVNKVKTLNSNSEKKIKMKTDDGD